MVVEYSNVNNEIITAIMLYGQNVIMEKNKQITYLDRFVNLLLVLLMQLSLSLSLYSYLSTNYSAEGKLADFDSPEMSSFLMR